jgi:hypothetical protein
MVEEFFPYVGLVKQQQQGSAPHLQRRGKHPMEINVEYEIEDLSFFPFRRRLTRPIMLHSIDQVYMQAVLLEGHAGRPPGPNVHAGRPPSSKKSQSWQLLLTASS